MKKVLVGVMSTLALSSCAVGGSSDYASLYESHMKYHIASMATTMSDMGMLKNIETEGTIRGALELPGMLSGSLNATVNGLINGIMASEVTFKDVNLAANIPMLGNQSLRLGEVSIVSVGADQFIRVQDVVSDLLSADDKTQLAQITNKWIALSPSEENMHPQELLAQKIAMGVFSLTQKDFEEILTQHKIFTSTEGATASGDVLVFPVTFDAQQTVAMVDTFSKKVAGTPLAEDIKQDMLADLQDIQITGTFGFKSGDASYFSANLELKDKTNEDGTDVVHITVVADKNGSRYQFHHATQPGVIVFETKREKDAYSLSGSVTRDNTVFLAANLKTTYNNKSLTQLDAALNADGVALNATYTRAKDGFNGNIGVNAQGIKVDVPFSGTFAGGYLSSFKLTSSTPFFGVDIDLAKQDTMARGPVKIAVSGQEIFSATIGLLARENSREEFGFTLTDIVAQGDDSFKTAKVELFTTQKEKNTSRKVTRPTADMTIEDLSTIMSLPTTGLNIPTSNIADPGMDDEMWDVSDLSEEELAELERMFAEMGGLEELGGLEDVHDSESIGPQ